MVEFALKPKLTLAPAATVPLYAALEAVTCLPLCVCVAFQMLVIDWLPGKLKTSFQLVIAVGPLVTVTSALNAGPQSLMT